jgi:peptidyl-prolyl cis-trans isomerase A (cyclophilin A)
MYRSACCLLLALALGATAQAGTLAQFRTTVGDLDVELFDQDKPITVRNFLSYVRGGRYQNMFFHRCLPGFIVQGGGEAVANPTSLSLFGQYFVVQEFPPITNEFNVGPRISNSYGTIAMAKISGITNSATSGFFFNLADNGANLDVQNGGFTVFGRVVRGTNVLENFNGRNKATFAGIQDLTFWFPTDPSAALFSDLPVSYDGPTYPRYVDLTYVFDISLLNIQVKLGTNRVPQISWQSVAAQTNYVEYTALTNRPPQWSVLGWKIGDGSVMTMTDTTAKLTKRFYRVRVDY